MKSRNKIYWAALIGILDDFFDLLENEFIDGKTAMGPWAVMTPKSWRKYGIGRIGPGFGQRYRRQPDGRWLMVEGLIGWEDEEGTQNRA